MIKKFIILSFISLQAEASTQTLLPALINSFTQGYTATNSTEAILEFDHTLTWPQTFKPSDQQIKDFIELEIKFLQGPMGYAAIKASVKGDHVLSNIKTEVDEKTGLHNISYHYKGTIALQNVSALGKRYTFVLPVNPNTIYAKAMKSEGGCTHPSHKEASLFWYFWSPVRRKCNLEKDVDFKIIQGTFTRLTSAPKTYPEYHRLPNENGEIYIDILNGMDRYTTDPQKVFESNDEGAKTFMEAHNELVSYGFTFRKITDAEMQEIVPTKKNRYPYVEILEQHYPEKNIQIIVRNFFGSTSIDGDSEVFHSFLKNSLEHSSLLIFNGHSGLGSNLDLERIATKRRISLQPNRDQYQIYYFNSCSSYSYYNDQYFKRKITEGTDPEGTKNLDIITNGLATSFTPGHLTDMMMVKAVHRWALQNKWMSFQSLANQADSENLLGINGDEDNITSPPDTDFRWPLPAL
jgi:hypothetical protein